MDLEHFDRHPKAMRTFWAAVFGLTMLAPTGVFAAAPAAQAPAAKPEAVDRERLAVHRLDIVDDKGVVRLSIAAPTPDPIIGGKVYPRAFPVSGIVIFDDKGNERGGFGVADVPGAAPVLALDHDNIDAVGWKVLPDGSVSFQINQKPPERRNAAGQILPASGVASPVRVTVGADGSPAITLTDKQDRPRVRLTVTDEGFGALEFVDANGKVIQTYAPEKDRRPGG